MARRVRRGHWPSWVKYTVAVYAGLMLAGSIKASRQVPSQDPPAVEPHVAPARSTAEARPTLAQPEARPPER